MIPANAVDIARIRKLLDIADEHLSDTQLDIYISGDYVSVQVQIRKAPEAADVLRLSLEALLIDGGD